MKRITLSLCVAAFAAFLAMPAQAQQARLGVNGQYAWDANEVQAGAELHVPVGFVQGLYFVPNTELYVQQDPMTFSVNGDLHYALQGAAAGVGAFSPYVGAGVGVTRDAQADEVGVGLNVIGGVNFPTGYRTMPFVQAEYRTGRYSEFSVGGGLRFIL